MAVKATKHFVYILRCADGTYYCGYTVDVERRVREHNGAGDTKMARTSGAKYTRPRRPVTVIYQEEFGNRSEATKREAFIKKLSRENKENLIKTVVKN